MTESLVTTLTTALHLFSVEKKKKLAIATGLDSTIL